MTITITFEPGLKPIIKHLAGQHDQKTHGRWASSGLPHELTNYKDIGQGNILRSLVIAEWGEEVVPYKKTETNWFFDGKVPEGQGWVAVGNGKYERVTDAFSVNDMDKPFTAWNVKKYIQDIEENGAMTPELRSKIDEIQKKYIGGRQAEVEAHYREEAKALGLSGRNFDYFVESMRMRTEIYVTNNNNMVRDELMKALAPSIPDDERRAIVESYYKNYDKTTKTIAANLEKGYPVVAIESDDFLKVVEDGRFKTQYETRESNGAYKPYLRRTREAAFLGVPQDTKASERPIYGYVATQVDGTTPHTSGYNRDKWNVDNTSVGQYGNVRVVLNDNVRDRTSYTIPDSLDGYALARPLTEKHTYETMSYAGLQHDLTTSHGGLQREGYIEAQVYGGIKLSDIKTIYVMPSEGTKVNTVTVNSIKNAIASKGLNIPVKELVPSKGES